MDIRIKSIHNLEKIQFYSINNNLKYLGCDVTCSNGTYSYSYKDKCFDEFISRVIEVYNKEKNNNILLVGDLTRKILDGKVSITNSNEYKNKNNILYTQFINENKLRDYIYLIVISLAQCNNLNNLKIDKLNKIKNKYLITCVEPYMQIPVEIINYDEKSIFIDLKFDEVYSCKISFDYEKDLIEAKSNSGKYLFSEFNIDNNNYVQINKDNHVLYYNEYNSDITDKEKSLLNCYTKIIGHNNLKFTKTIFNNYLSQNETSKEINEVKIDKFMINLSSDKVNIKYFESLKYKLESVYLPYYNIYHDINIVMIDNEHLLVQDIVDDRYKYTIVEISKMNNLFDDFDIKNKFDIDEDIKYKSDVVTLIKSRRV